MADLRTRLEAAVGREFTIERELGGGGMSRVFVAEERRFGRRVVIKVFACEVAGEFASERFEREISLAARLQDPHIVPVLSSGVADGLPYFTMPFVDGETLRARLSGHATSLAAADSESILRDVALALEYAHAHGIAHRDIKPENVLIAGRTAVVADFGIAKALAAATEIDPAGDTTLTRAGVTLGTPAYMAPEQVAGEAIDQRADVYAWGVVAYELLTGAHPFAHRSGGAQLMAAQLSEEPPPIRGGPDARLNALVMRCLAKDPAHRPGDGAALVRDFDAAIRANAPVADRRAAWLVRAAAVAVVALIALVAALLLNRAARRVPLSGAPIAVTPGVSAASIASGGAGTVAVLPFTNVSADQQDEYFSEGMTDELARALSRLPSIRVAARSSAYAFRGRNLTGQEIGRALHVASVVEGTVRRAGARLRVTAELTNTADGLVAWSDTYESSSGDVFEVQDRFTKSIVAALAPTLAGRSPDVASESRGTANREAYDLYLKGRYFWNKRTPEGLNRAVTYFREAIARDPAYALAYSGMADSYAVLAAFGYMEPRAAYARAKPAAQRALALDSTVAEAHTSLGFIDLFYDLDPVAAHRELERAIALDPNYATAHLFNGWCQLVQRGPEEALREVRIAERIEPLSLIISARVATMLLYGRRYEDAEQQLARTLEVDSTFGVAEDQLARVLAAKGEFARSVLVARKALAAGYVHARGILGYSLARGGNGDAARAIVDTLISESRKDYVAPYDVALVFTGLGERARAIEWLSKSLRVRDHEFLELPQDPLLESLHGDPRFGVVSSARK